MEDKFSFNSTDFTVSQLVDKIERGELGLPSLQRQFVWKNTQVRDLFDSMLRGYPVGYLMLWECPEFDKKKTIGKTKTHESPNDVIIDGQQRLTALYAVMKGEKFIDAEYKEREIIISFRPVDRTFEVGTTNIKNNPDWIYNISDLFTKTGTYSYVTAFIDRLQKSRESDNKTLEDSERDKISKHIEELYRLKDYKFYVFQIASDADEEDVSQVFVRINSRGKTLTQNNFILTLLSVHWDEGRRKIEDFCKASTVHAPATSFNSLGIEISSQDVIRTVMAYAFNRAKLIFGYKLLRGTDFEKKGVINEELREKNFEILKAKLPDVMNVTNWHEFLKAIMNAGYFYDNMILSKNAIYFTYAMYLIAKYRFKAHNNINKALASLWFFHSALTSLYSNSTETVAESHLTAIKDYSSLDEYKRFIITRVNESLTDDYFNITLPGSGQGGLAVSGSGNNAWFAYVAALNILNRKVLFSQSNLTVRDFIISFNDGKKKPLEKHHLFPKSYLKKLNYPDTMINQMANYAFIDWNDNEDISGEAPSVYYPLICRKMHLTPDEINIMEQENALPLNWQNMNYEDFLEARRVLMARIIKQGFETLKGKI